MFKKRLKNILKVELFLTLHKTLKHSVNDDMQKTEDNYIIVQMNCKNLSCVNSHFEGFNGLNVVCVESSSLGFRTDGFNIKKNMPVCSCHRSM